MNASTWRKAIHGAYLDYYGEQISEECVSRIIDYYKQLTKDERIKANSFHSKRIKESSQ